MQIAQSVGSRRQGAPGHLVQFYDGEPALADALARYFRPVREGAARGYAIATPEHRAAIEAAAPGATIADARATLRLILADGWPDPGLFESAVGAPLRRMAAGGQPVLAFGEMVVLLCRDGRPDAAIALERIWNRFIAEVGIRLLCTYPIGAFSQEFEAETIGEHCDDPSGPDAPVAAVASTSPAAPAVPAVPAVAAVAAVASPAPAPVPDLPPVSAVFAVTPVPAGAMAPGAVPPSVPTVVLPPHGQADSTGLLQAEQRRREDLERELAAREAELRDFVANGPDGMHQVDEDGVIIWVNQAELTLLGYERREYVGQRIHRFHEDPAVIDDIFACLRDGRPVANRPSRLRCKDGSWKDVLISSNAVRRDGRLWRTRCVVRDATGLVRAQREREEALQRLRAHEAQQAAVARLGALALAAPLPELFGAVVREVAAVYGVPLAAISEVLPGGRYRMVAGVGWRADLLNAINPLSPDPEAQGNQALASSEPVVYEDLLTETRFKPSPIVLEHGARSGITVAIGARGRPWGVVAVLSPRPGHFRRDDADFLAAVGNLLSAALERRDVEADLRARELQQAAVARLGREALARRELGSLFDAAAREVAATLGVEFAGVLQLDPDGHHLALRAGHGWRPGLVGKARVPAGHGSQSGYVLGGKGPLVYHDLQRETRFTPSALLADHGCHSGMIATVETRAGPFGTLGAHTAQPRRFTPDDANFLVAVAHVLASAIERKAYEDEMQRSRAHLEDTVADRTRQLAASNRELEAFSYSVSHDLRAPLRTISGYASLLEAKHGGELGPPARQLLEGVRKGADRLGRLIDDLLDLSRVQRVDLVRQAVDLSALASQRLREMAASEPARRVEAAVEPGLRATGDPRLLGMLLDNLLANAWKFTRHTADARIEVGRQGTEEDAVFFVKDNGAGFDMAYSGRLFQPFQRLHRPSEFEGTGVGLATVQRIVERHGGRVWADGRVGKGAAFYFTLGD